MLFECNSGALIYHHLNYYSWHIHIHLCMLCVNGRVVFLVLTTC